jgi:hypothetical protein
MIDLGFIFTIILDKKRAYCSFLDCEISGLKYFKIRTIKNICKKIKPRSKIIVDSDSFFIIIIQIILILIIKVMKSKF